MNKRILMALPVAGLLALTACGGSGGSSDSASSSPIDQQLAGQKPGVAISGNAVDALTHICNDLLTVGSCTNAPTGTEVTGHPGTFEAAADTVNGGVIVLAKYDSKANRDQDIHAFFGGGRLPSLL